MSTWGIRASLKAAVSVAALVAASPALAQNIDTTPSWNGTNYISSWGESNTATYGQTITATPTQSRLTGFTFYLAQSAGTPPQFQAFVYQWDAANSRITGPALATTAAQIAPATPNNTTYVPVSVNFPAAVLTPGQQYVLMFTTSSIQPPNPAAATYRYGSLTNNTTYPGGQFVFQNNGDNFNNLFNVNWSFIPQDLAFIALLSPNVLSALLPFSSPINAINVANGIDAFTLGGGTLPAAFQGLFGLTPDQLSAALIQMGGQNTAGAQQSSYQLMNGFLSLLSDPAGSGRFGGPAGPGGPMPYAPQTASLPADAANAYAAILKAPPPAAPQQRWSVWAAGYGGYNKTDGNAAAGSADLGARAYGYATGFDYRLSPDAIVGFSLAGGHTSWGLSGGLGGGSSEAFQAGVYGFRRLNNFYVSGALAGAVHDVDTNRTVTLPAAESLRGNSNAMSLGARIEGGYTYVLPAVNVTPYAAAQAQHYNLDGYTETGTLGAFGLSYRDQSATVGRTELGAKLNRAFAMNADAHVNVFGRMAWAHDWNTDRIINATFLALPTSGFTVNGATPSSDLALIDAGAEFFTRSRWSVMAKFQGEFGSRTETYMASGRVRYTW